MSNKLSEIDRCIEELERDAQFCFDRNCPNSANRYLFAAALLQEYRAMGEKEDGEGGQFDVDNFFDAIDKFYKYNF